jgi:hypothetical protein
VLDGAFETLEAEGVMEWCIADDDDAALPPPPSIMMVLLLSSSTGQSLPVNTAFSPCNFLTYFEVTSNGYAVVVVD